MNPILFHFKRIPWFLRVLTGGCGGVAVLSLALAAPDWQPQQPRAMPPPPTRLRSESRPVAGPLTLTSLSVGAKPWVMAAGRHVGATFVTDDPESCRLLATARLRPGLDPQRVRWTVAAPQGFLVPLDGVWTGPKLDVTLRRPGGNPSGFGGPLVLTVQAQVVVDGQEYTARETIVQDEIDQLRQEYVDLGRREVPERSQFLDAAAFAARFGRRYPWLHFEDLNWSVNPTTRLRYSFAIIQPELVEGLDRVRRLYGSVTINSGYRNPTRQVEVHAPVRESLHQYGYAADLAVIPVGGRALPNEVDWRRLAEVACGARAKWVEPLTSSAPNSPGCHVHLDYRPGPVSSAPMGVRGQVVAAETGKPVAGALVLLGGMPCRTDADGVFAIRNVLSGGPYPVEVRADGYEALAQPVALAAWRTVFARLQLHRTQPPAVTASVARAEWLDQPSGLLAVTLRVTNAGSAAVDDMRVSAAPEQAVLVSQTPASLGTLPPGAARGVRLLVRVPGGQDRAVLPVAVGLTFRVATGGDQYARFPLLAALPDGRPTPGIGVASKAPAAAKPEPPLPAEPSVTAPAASAPARQTALKGGAPPSSAASSAPAPEPAKETLQMLPDPAKPPASETPAAPANPDPKSPAAAEPKPAARESKPASEQPKPSPGETKPSP
jgi:hypothetical protein